MILVLSGMRPKIFLSILNNMSAPVTRKEVSMLVKEILADLLVCSDFLKCSLIPQSDLIPQS